MNHQIPNLIGIDSGKLDHKVRKSLPGYMTKETTGMGDMGMKVPRNSIPMLGGEGPFSYVHMGGMFAVQKVCENLSTYADLGCYQHPTGTASSVASPEELKQDLGEVPDATGTQCSTWIKCQCCTISTGGKEVYRPNLDSSLRHVLPYRRLALIWAAAFLCGAGAMWFAVRPDEPLAPPTSLRKIETSPISRPPGVSRLPPIDAEVAMANWNYDQQNWLHAIEHYERAIAFGRDNPDVRTDLGNCYRFLGQITKALELYQIAQREDPQHEKSLFNQASLYAEGLNEPAKAVAAAREFIERFPQSSGVTAARQLIARLEGASGSSEQRLREWLSQEKSANSKAGR